MLSRIFFQLSLFLFSPLFSHIPGPSALFFFLFLGSGGPSLREDHHGSFISITKVNTVISWQFGSQSLEIACGSIIYVEIKNKKNNIQLYQFGYPKHLMICKIKNTYNEFHDIVNL